MRLSALFVSLSIVAAWLAPSAASPLADAARQLDGEWRGDGYVLRVDSGRAQASIDPARPFEWRRFEVKEARDGEVVFVVGAELFQATLDDEMLVLTGTGFRGERVLFRDPRLRGTTAD